MFFCVLVETSGNVDMKEVFSLCFCCLPDDGELRDHVTRQKFVAEDGVVEVPPRADQRTWNPRRVYV